MSQTEQGNRQKLIIVMGVSGSGKSSVAQAIAEKLNFDFYEADDFHSAEAKAWMASGKPLNDDMRAPWIKAMCQAIQANANNQRSAVLSYSGLKRKHRQKFRELGLSTIFIFLDGSIDLIASRMKNRENHFMPASLLKSQFDAMEAPKDETDIIKLDIDRPLSDLTNEAVKVIEASFAR